MNKKVLLISSVLLTLSLITVVIFNNVDNKENNIISNINKDKQVINGNMITMMYETESGSGEYIETKDISWPESGYIFNDTLSGCENGGELEYNSENNTVNLLSHSSDQCYVYFDKYDGVWIDNVVATNVTGSSITLDVSATSENGSITTYYYSLNDSEEYIETTTNPIIIDDLNKLTEYNIKIYAIDNTGAKSNIYEISVSTTDISVPVINNVDVSNITTSGFTLTVDVINNTEISNYYYIISDNIIFGTDINNRYSFTNLESGTLYNVVVFVEDINGMFSQKYEIEVQTRSGLLFADYIKSLYTSQGSNGLYYHTSTLANSAGDDSYRYSGANPNNYVCFGSNATACPSDSLYRIIGVFDNQVKLIKNSRYTDVSYSVYKWNAYGSGNWERSNLYLDLLNGSFLVNLYTIDKNALELIYFSSVWKVGGVNNLSRTPKSVYDSEMIYSTESVVAPVGLMYVSDYGFAASPDYWGINVGTRNYNRNSNNWMTGIGEWTISKDSSNSSSANRIVAEGEVQNSSISSYTASIRPCFYLISEAIYLSGSGTESDPYRIGL